MNKLLAWQPAAVAVRPAGRCPICKQDTQVSYTLAGTGLGNAGDGVEYCGYWCDCGFDGSGRRMVTGSDNEISGG